MLAYRILAFLVCSSFAGIPSYAQSEASTASPTPPAAKLDYPNSTSGLEHLAKDIIEAQKKDDGPRADLLLKSMVLPNPVEWYKATFEGTRVGEYYSRVAPGIPRSLAKTFLDSQSQRYTRIEARRFENTCDDNSPENTYDVLLRRREPLPIYELRFLNKDRFMFIFAIAYVDGGFRFVLPLDYQPPKSAEEKAESNSPDAPHTPRELRVQVGGAVQAARLVTRVQPVYPQVAKDERLQGKVSIHVIVGKDGSIRQMDGVRGRCSLAKSAVEAVRQWRYEPTLLNGYPVEVDTEITVIFQLTP